MTFIRRQPEPLHATTSTNRTTDPRRFGHALAMLLTLLLLASALVARADEASQAKYFDIAPQPLASALLEISRQGDVDVLAPEELTRGQSSPAIRGSMTPAAALELALSQTRLTYRLMANGAFVVEPSTTKLAQNGMPLPEPDAGASGTGIDEIIVTARKRQESILKVPVVATAVTQERLSKYAARDLYSISDQVPGLQIGAGSGNNGAQVSLRGVGANPINPTIDQSVSLNIDGMQMTQGNAYKVGMFDLAQVEVLKGPQGLFYGKNSPGGVISMRSADPSDRFETSARVGYEYEAEQRRAELIISGPVAPTLGLRLATSYSDSEGFFRNEAVGATAFGGVTPKYKDFGPEKEWIIRGTALWNPSERFNARLKGNFARSRRDEDSGVGQFISCPDGTTSPTGIPFLAGEDCKADRVIRLVDMDPAVYDGIRNGGVPFADYDQAFGSLEMNLELTPAMTLTSVTGYYDLEQSVLLNASAATGAGPTLASQGDFDRRDFTQEVRLSSDFRGPLNFLVGGFYQDGFMRNALDSPLNQIVRPGPARLSLAYHDIDVRSLSFFGQVLWQVVPNVELTAGARWTEEERRHKQINLITGTPQQTALAVPKIKSDNVSPEFTATYTPTTDLTFFASYKEGFKSGSFNTAGTQAPGTDTSFGDERVKGFEAGIKSRLFDRSVLFNFAGYHYEYRDLQVGANEITPTGQIAIRTLNAASATIYGVDMDVVYQPRALRDLSLRAALNWNHARYDKFDNAPCWGGQLISQGCDRYFNPATGRFNGQDLSGGRLLRAPDWSATFGFDYELPVGEDMTLVFGSNTTYSSKFYTNILLRDDMVQEGVFKTSASVALKDIDGAWEVALVGTNLNNELTCASAVNGNFQNGVLFGGQGTGSNTPGVAGSDELICPLSRGREVWMRFTVAPHKLFARQ